MNASTRRLAIVTGASAASGYHLARECAGARFDLLVAADEPGVAKAAEEFRAFGIAADAVEADLSTLEGVDRVLPATGGRGVYYLFANAGHGLGNAISGSGLRRSAPYHRHEHHRHYLSHPKSRPPNAL